MTRNDLNGWIVGACLGASASAGLAQEASEIQRLKEQLRQATERFEQTTREQRAIIESLQQRLEALEQGPTNAAHAAAHAPESIARSGRLGAVPLRLAKGSAFMDVGLIGTFAVGGSTTRDIEGGTQLGGHDPNQRGFTLQGVEAVFSGAVDPYFRGLATVTYGLDSGNESFLEVEEAWLETMSLPAGLQLRAGQLLTEFGRHNPTHVHAWSFVDTPLPHGRLLGGDGLRNPGARLSWLMPVPFYSELMFSVQNSSGETAASFRAEDEANVPLGFRPAENDRGIQRLTDLLFAPRYAVSFDLTEQQVLLAGVSAAFGPNARGSAGSRRTDTELYGLDLTWKWKSPRAVGGFPFVTWQSEALLRRYEAGGFDWDLNGNGAADAGEIIDTATGLPASLRRERLKDYGFYSQVLWGFRKGCVAGLRGDFVTGERGDYERRALTLDGNPLGRDGQRALRWRLSPNVTWYPSEFSKIRLQYNYDDRRYVGDDHSVWLQFEFLLGAHAAHKF